MLTKLGEEVEAMKQTLTRLAEPYSVRFQPAVYDDRMTISADGKEASTIIFHEFSYMSELQLNERIVAPLKQRLERQ
jgi:hypothetical protein